MIEKSLPIALVFVLIGFQKGKEKVNEEVIAIPFVDPTEAPITDSKKKKQKKFEWEVNRVYQNPWVTRFLKICTCFWKGWQNEKNNMHGLLQN